MPISTSSSNRQTIRVALPCGTCIHSGICDIELQLEQDLTLAIIDIGRPVEIGVTCSIYEPAQVNEQFVALAEARSAKASKAARARWDARNAPEHREVRRAG